MNEEEEKIFRGLWEILRLEGMTADQSWSADVLAAFKAAKIEGDRMVATGRAFSQMQKDSDRAVGIVGASLVDEELSLCLERHFIRTSSNYRDRATYLMAPTGPLGAFATKIDLGWILGLYSNLVCNELVVLRDVRNRFAHKYLINSFEHSDIASRCSKLTLAERFLVKTTTGYEIKITGPTGDSYSYQIPAIDAARTIQCGLLSFVRHSRRHVSRGTDTSAVSLMCPHRCVNGQHHFFQIVLGWRVLKICGNISPDHSVRYLAFRSSEGGDFDFWRREGGGGHGTLTR